MQYTAASTLKGSVGSILWLPPKSEVSGTNHYATNVMDDGCFNHPVLVLAANTARTEVIVLVITSFGGKDLKEKYPRKFRIRSEYIPIDPTGPHPDNDSILYLKGLSRLDRNSYVNTRCRGPIKAVLLQPLRHSKRCVLRADSLQELIEKINFTSPWKATIPKVLHTQTPSPPGYHVPAAQSGTPSPPPSPTFYHIPPAVIRPNALVQTPPPKDTYPIRPAAIRPQIPQHSASHPWPRTYISPWEQEHSRSKHVVATVRYNQSYETTPLLLPHARTARPTPVSRSHNYSSEGGNNSESTAIGVVVCIFILVFIAYQWDFLKFT